MKGKEWTEAEHDTMRAMAAAGHPNREIAKALGRSNAAITNRARVLGIKLPNFREHKIDDAQAAAFVAKLEHGWTQERICREYGIAKQTLAGAIRRAGYQPKRYRGKYDAVREAHAAYSGKVRLADAAASIDMTVYAFTKALYRLGLQWQRAPIKRAPQEGRPYIARPNWANGTQKMTMPEVGTTTRAAQYLAREFKPVVRADIARLGFGKWPRPTHYQVGRHVVPVETMLEMARERGFGG